MHHHLKLGTRTSTMAIAVANHTKKLIETSSPHVRIDVLPFSSLGDQFQGDLKTLGGKGAFINNLQQRLLDGEIDCAIHALKDIPGDVPPHPELVLCSFLQRGDPRDALIMRTGTSLPTSETKNMTIGTSSLRRMAQLKRLYPHINVVPFRGNADTRIRKLEDGAVDGIVLSKSGLDYLGRGDVITKCFDPFEMLPSVGQGVLVLQIRKADFDQCPFLQSINHVETERVVGAERALLRTLQGDCYSAIAAHCHHDDHGYHMTASVFSPHDFKMMSHHQSVADAQDLENLGHAIAENLIAQGAKDLMQTAA